MEHDSREVPVEEWLGTRILERLLIGGEPVDLGEYQASFQQASKKSGSSGQRFKEEKLAARKEVAALLKLALPARRKRLKRNYWRLKSRSVICELLRRSRAAVWTDLPRAEQLAEDALQVLRQIKGHRLVWNAGGKLGLADLEARIYGQLGNTARLRRQWPAAFERFTRAFKAWDLGSLDPEIEAELHSLYGSLLRDRQHLETALESLTTAAGIYQELEQEHRRGRVALQLATVLWELGGYEDATRVHMDGVLLLDERKEPETTLAAWSNLANLYLDLDKIYEANSVLKSSVGLARTLAKNSAARICWLWVAGRVALVRNDDRAAERRLLRVRAYFSTRGDAYNAGRAGLDLSRLFASRGRLEDLHAIMPSTVEQLLNQDLHRDAKLAVEAYRQAVEERREQVLATILSAAAALKCRSKLPGGQGE